MITRILQARLPLMIYTPVKVFDIPYCNAIYAAGALPVFDTEFLTRQDILQKTAILSKENISFGLGKRADIQSGSSGAAGIKNQ
ncbi:MAG: hypothetical protein LC660_01015 [Desulfobacteraceae bacterium]|nr:hypothetical protein [Desulfobacteraceae bacterium]